MSCVKDAYAAKLVFLVGTRDILSAAEVKVLALRDHARWHTDQSAKPCTHEHRPYGAANGRVRTNTRPRLAINRRYGNRQ